LSALPPAAARTANVRKPPKPFYCRSNFPHFYVEYTLLARFGNEKLRTETLPELHSAIQAQWAPSQRERPPRTAIAEARFLAKVKRGQGLAATVTAFSSWQLSSWPFSLLPLGVSSLL
jgi:hypothetical protein